jgi:putative hydrolase of the HAD superfamily
MAKYEWLLFDIGGVLLEFIGAPKILEWMNWRVSREEMSRMWLYSESVRSFETGKITSDEFAEQIIRELGFSVKADEFIEGFSCFPKGLHAGVKEFLNELSTKYPLATLSNTNEIHWNRLCQEDHFDQLIQHNFLSFQTGYMKPDKEAYLNVINKLNCSPGKIIFFDDNRINVEAARDAGMDAGMDAVYVAGFGDLKEQMVELRI